MNDEYAVISSHLITTRDGFDITHSWDAVRHPTRDAAITHGFDTLGHDDFCIGRLQDDDLLWFGWMGQPHPDEDRQAVAEHLGLRAPIRPSVFGMVSEFHNTLGQDYGDGGARREGRKQLQRDETDELCDALDADDRTGIARELADVVYVAYGTAFSEGIDLDAVIAEVHAANMRKQGTNGRFTVREDGKVLKPDGWTPPDVASVVALPPSSRPADGDL